MKPLDDGAIELMFALQGGQRLIARMAGSEVGTFVGALLGTTHASFFNSGKVLDEAQRAFGQLSGISVSRWLVGATKTQGQEAIIVQVGEASIGFIIPHDEKRNLARFLLRSSYDPGRSATTWALLRDLLRDVFVGLRGWSSVFRARLKASLHRRAISFSLWISGRSLRIFRTIDVGPDTRVPSYPAVGECIYCGEKAYSKKPGIRQHPLGAEHIIAEGLGGNLELPEASCQRCEDATGRFVEGDVLGRTLKALRIHLKLRSSGSGPPPKTLPLDATVDGREQKIEIPIEDYPIVFNMIGYTPYRFVAEHVGPGRAAQGAITSIIKYDPRALYQKYKITGFASAYWDTQMLTRMLAKIGHSFAVAEIGANKFRPVLLELIRKGDVGAMSLVGGSSDWGSHKASKALHEAGLGYQQHRGKTYVVARIRLFARYNGPVYCAVVGESLESSIARWRRVFSNGISRIVAR